MFVCFASPAPATVTSAAPPAINQEQTSNEEKARSALATDTSLPTTTVQVRLVDGSRLAATFNHTHTVGDLRQYIVVYPFKLAINVCNTFCTF